MLSLIEVQCPHCGARGQIMIPPVGAIIIGPCPQCSELVVVFCGHVLGLDRQIMEDGTVDERREHLLGVLTEFLQDRIYKMLDEDIEDGEIHAQESGEELSSESASLEGPSEPAQRSNPISRTEVERFTDIDLKLLDNKAYFKSVFEES